MSDADTISKLMTRLASLEQEVSRHRSAPPAGIDPAAMRAGLISDPIGFMTKHGIPIDHVTRVAVAHAMGDNAPPELKVLAQMGPQVSETRELKSQLEQLSRQVSSFVDLGAKNGARESFRTLANDKAKYPHLARAVSADPDLFREELDRHGGTPEELATALEARQAKFAAAYGFQADPPPASGESAEATVQSTQGKPAVGDVPPLKTGGAGIFTPEEHLALRNEIVSKYAPKT